MVHQARQLALPYHYLAPGGYPGLQAVYSTHNQVQQYLTSVAQRTNNPGKT